MESLKRLGGTGNSRYTESLPAPSLLSSSAAIDAASAAAAVLLKSSQQPLEISPSISTATNNQNSFNDAIKAKPENDGRFVVVESIQQQQSQFIHHALSSAKNRHRRSLTMGSSNSNLNRRLINKRYIVKRNFPNNQLSKASEEMDVDDSNETELDGVGDGENDDYIEREEEAEGEKEKAEEKQKNISNDHDRLDVDDNESDLEKSMKLFVPYWDVYDTVNQLFLEISEYTSLLSVANCMTNHHLLYQKTRLSL